MPYPTHNRLCPFCRVTWATRLERPKRCPNGLCQRYFDYKDPARRPLIITQDITQQPASA